MLEDGRKLTLVLSDRRLDTDTAPQLDAELKRNLGGQPNRDLAPVKHLVIDMAAVAYISSAGLRVLLSALHELGDEGSVTLRHVGDGVRHTLEITGFSEIFTIQ